MTTNNSSIAQLQIIIGESFFTPGNTVVGIAIKGQTDSIGCTKWAETIKGRGRPASVNPLNGHKDLDVVIARMREAWLEWAEACGIQITIVAETRKVGKF
jgi:hypothetical protein